MSGGVPAFLGARRSIRSFTTEPVARTNLDAIVEAACIAPAPHHSRPWRFAVVDTALEKEALAQGMGARWRVDLAGATLYRFVYTACLRDGLLYADPHPGNFLFRPDEGAVWILDFGCVQELDADFLRLTRRMHRAAMDGRPDIVRDTAVDLGGRRWERRGRKLAK